MSAEKVLTGKQRIDALFEQIKAEGRAAFLPYHAMGYPSRAETLDIIKALAAAGADAFEIGLPHSDPLADGPTV
ncbi:MAG: tryptophan synthase subunit alpha, partial [Simplicispira sp.]|nr:tryptophan synthase subunit alpha [Simplicispira sp.]